MNALCKPQISRIVHFTCAPQHLHGVSRLTCENVWKFAFAFSNLWSDILNLDYKCVGYMPLLMGSHRNHRNHSSCYNSYMKETLLKTILSVKLKPSFSYCCMSKIFEGFWWGDLCRYLVCKLCTNKCRNFYTMGGNVNTIHINLCTLPCSICLVLSHDLLYLFS